VEAHEEKVPHDEEAPTKRSIGDLRHDQSPEGRRAYADRLRELGFKEDAIQIMLNPQRPQG